ncbi:hypothetical protein ACYFX5_01045 [Bremerella sp. T1]|uniref:hypothetical protein n=1 Tax=Bremerella sp. TYQ1 TaxID=3119568 RepID=UPI001CCB2818|nr:hypothetical protein [Bremerella volcania]UBM36875.1 hypothetical protein LA756_03005 [Bremerella volcania]
MTPIVKSLMASLVTIALILAGSFSITGCTDQEAIQAIDQEAVQEGQNAIERIKKDRAIPRRQKQIMIERIQMEVKEQTGESISAE